MLMQLHPAEHEWPDGEPGSPIHGSQFYRGYCPGCGTAMRVVDPDWAGLVWCEHGSDDDGTGTVYTHLRTQIDQWAELW